MDDVVIRAQCPWCGPVTLKPSEMACAHEPRGQVALCEFSCPHCGRLVFIPVQPEHLGPLQSRGLQRPAGAIPLELLERHRGPALSWDEVLDLHLALRQTAYPQDEMRFQSAT